MKIPKRIKKLIDRRVDLAMRLNVFVSYLYSVGDDETVYANCVVSVDRRIKDYYDIAYLSKRVEKLSSAGNVVILYYKEMGRRL